MYEQCPGLWPGRWEGMGPQRGATRPCTAGGRRQACVRLMNQKGQDVTEYFEKGRRKQLGRSIKHALGCPQARHFEGEKHHAILQQQDHPRVGDGCCPHT